MELAEKIYQNGGKIMDMEIKKFKKYYNKKYEKRTKN